ncbi:MAG TPA: DUF2179 domain-containing protein [Pseudogracilibacillus sp.]|nr:DUF2179 domain-containing protein [Pseudogracilibacillus sp.]
MLSNAYGIVLTILVINIVYVSFSTMRMILTLKGRRYLAALASTFEVVVYIIGLSIVLDNLEEIQNIIAYAIGFALGIIIGSKIEERLALGYITVNVISTNPELPFTKKLREKGFGVTTWKSYGMEGDRLSIQVLAPRKQELFLYKIITDIDPKAFIISYEPKHIQGGFWLKQVRKQRIIEAEQEAERKEKLDQVREEKEDDYEAEVEITPPHDKPLSQKPNVKPKL